MVKFVGRGAGGGVDARSLLIAKKRSNMTDARDKLAQIARTGDARDKIKKIRNLKQGKLDVKQTAKGGITIVTTTKGQLQLTTKKKTAAANARQGKAKPGAAPAGKAALKMAVAQAAASTRAGKRGNLTRRVGKGGALTISTKKKGTVIKPAAGRTDGGRISKPARSAPRQAASAPTARGNQSRSGRGNSSGGRTGNNVSPAKLTRTIRGRMSEAARLDEELLSTHVDPLVIKRTVKQAVRDHSPPSRRYVPTTTLRSDSYRDSRRDSRDRSRSPMDTDYGRDSYRGGRPVRRSYNDYDDPRSAMEKEDELYRRRIKDDYPEHTPRTMAGRLDGNTGASSSSFVSPLQGAKITVSNLQETVSQDDITELFGDIGPLKRTKVVKAGSFEVVFVNRADALKAVEIYHNRQLDGKAMKCTVVHGGGSAPTTSTSFPKSSRSEGSSSLHPEMDAIHRALFAERPSSGGASGSQSRRERGEASSSSRPSKPLFSVTMPQRKGGRR